MDTFGRQTRSMLRLVSKYDVGGASCLMSVVCVVSVFGACLCCAGTRAAHHKCACPCWYYGRALLVASITLVQWPIAHCHGADCGVSALLHAGRENGCCGQCRGACMHRIASSCSRCTAQDMGIWQWRAFVFAVDADVHVHRRRHVTCHTMPM